MNTSLAISDCGRLASDPAVIVCGADMNERAIPLLIKSLLSIMIAD